MLEVQARYPSRRFFLYFGRPMDDGVPWRGGEQKRPAGCIRMKMGDILVDMRAIKAETRITVFSRTECPAVGVLGIFAGQNLKT